MQGEGYIGHASLKKRAADMNTYTDMTFEELLKYKDRLIEDGGWSRMDIDEKKETNDELERKLKLEKDSVGAQD